MIERLERVEQSNPKEYWDIIKQLREKKADNTISNPDDFKAFYEKLFSLDKDREISEEHRKIEAEVLEMLSNEGSSTLRRVFTLKEFREAVRKLKNNKASGPDGILAEMLKDTPEALQIIILALVNRVVTSCYYPQKWAEGITSLLLKEGDEEDPNNFRAITVASAISKVLAIMLDERLEKFVKENKVMTPLQIGFEKKARPADHLFVLRNLIDSYTIRNKKLYACFVDFQKAYGSISPNLYRVPSVTF